MKVQLVSATYNAAFSYMRRFLGLGYVHAAALADPDIARDVEITHDFYNTYEMTPEEVAEDVLQKGAEVVAFAVYTWNVRDILKICRLLKEARPSLKVLLGGPEVSYHYNQILAEHEFVDWICAGEGEQTFPELLRHHMQHPGQAPDQVAGMAFRHDGVVGMAPPRPFHPRLDELPSPFLTGVLGLDELLHSAYFQTTRGCPFTCTYCDYGRNQPYYEFGLERVREELRYFQEHKAKALFAVDATFNYRRGRANEILRTVAELGFEGMFAIEVFPSLIDDEMVEILESVKFAHVGIGIQTANPVAMRNIHRIWSPRRIQDKIERLCEMDNVIVSLEMIMGLPGDNLQTFKDTLDWSYEREPHHIFALPLQILSRTPLEKQVEQYDIKHTGPTGSNEILSCYSFPHDEIMLGKAICSWHAILQPVVYRLSKLLGLKPSDILDRWAHHAYYEGLYDRQHELLRNRVEPDLLEHAERAFRGFLQDLCAEVGKPDVSPMMTELWRYLVLRRSRTREGAFFADVLDVSCITTEEKYHKIFSTLPGDRPAPNGLDLERPLRAADNLVWERFDYDIGSFYAELDAERMAATPPRETLLVFFQDPQTGAGRAVRVDEFSRRLVAGCDGSRRLADVVPQLGETGDERSPEDSARSVAEVLLGCGVLSDHS